MMKDELPVGWAMARVGQLGEVQLGKMLDRAKNSGTPALYLRNINVRWFGFDLTDLKTVLVSPEELDRFSVLDGDLFICEGGEPGRAGVWRNGKSDLVYQKALHRFRTNGSILPDLIMYRFRLDAEVGSLHQSFSGSTIKHFTKESLVKYQIPLAPLPEQKRIADKLEAVLGRVDACRTRLDRVPALLKRFRQSVLAAATSGRLTEEWRQNSEYVDTFVEYPYSHTIKGPSEWTPTTFGNVCDLIGGSQPPKSTFTHEDSPSVIRLIQIRDYKSDKHLVYIPRKLARRFCSKTDVMIGRYGPPIFQILRGIEGAYNVALMKAQPKDSRLDLDYLYYWLQQDVLLRYVEAGSDRTAGQDGVRKELVESYPLFLPPIPEQKEIVRRVEVLFAFADRIEARLAAAQATVARLTPATLAKAFRGELVPQDPDDEPAAVLLERIATLKDVAPAKKVRAKRPARA